MVTLISNSPEETMALGQAWARKAVSGWVIGLSGELGSGKTQLVRGLALGMGIVARVHSPTFALIHQYEGTPLTLFHLDLYRLDHPEAVFAAGLDDYLYDPQGVTVVEWAERWLGPDPLHRPISAWPHLPRHYRHVTFETLSAACRRMTYEDAQS